MFFAMKRALAVLLAPVVKVAAARQARAQRRLAQRAQAVLALVQARPRQVVLLAPGLPLQQVLQEAQLLRLGVVPAGLEQVPQVLEAARNRASPKSSSSRARTARSTTRRRR